MCNAARHRTHPRTTNTTRASGRFYGCRHSGEAGAQQAVFVEQKTHKEKWAGSGERSFKVWCVCVVGVVRARVCHTVPRLL
jgi:hypothetical protein